MLKKDTIHPFSNRGIWGGEERKGWGGAGVPQIPTCANKDPSLPGGGRGRVRGESGTHTGWDGRFEIEAPDWLQGLPKVETIRGWLGIKNATRGETRKEQDKYRLRAAKIGVEGIKQKGLSGEKYKLTGCGYH